jgi:hypothetical protein
MGSAAMSVLNHTTQIQINGWFCGPAATRVALTCRGLAPSQQELAGALGTTTNGTNSSNDVARVLNAYLGAGTYAARFLPGQTATEPEVAQLKVDLVNNINAGFGIVSNVAGQVRTLDGSYYSYPGGHYVAAVGYRNNGDEVLIADVNVRDYWVSTRAWAIWIATRGYTFSVKVGAVVTPPTTRPVGESLYIIDIARYQDGLDVRAVKNAGVQALNIKTTQGNSYTYDNARHFAVAARQEGLGVCTFHWLDNSSPGDQQARIAYNAMKLISDGNTAGMAHQCDCESNASWAIIQSYVTTMQQLLGRPIILYTGDWWWQASGRNWNGASLTPYLWAAPNDGYPGTYPGDGSPQWNAGYGGWPTLAAMQFGVSPISGFAGDVSKTMIRTSAWSALTGTMVSEEEDMIVLVRVKDKPAIFASQNGQTLRWLTPAGLANLQLQGKNGVIQVWHQGQNVVIEENRTALLEKWGEVIGPKPPKDTDW